MQYQQLTEIIIGCAFKVYNRMGFGFLESVYEKCLLIELKKEKFNVKTQVPLTVYYESNIVGEFVVDILINNKIILELKSVRKLAKNHEIQLVNYLVATRKDIGILLNFGEKKVEIKRKYRILTNAA